MEPEKFTAEINRLSIPQKLILTQDIWDSIARESGKLPMPGWQKKNLIKDIANTNMAKCSCMTGSRFIVIYEKRINENSLYCQS